MQYGICHLSIVSVRAQASDASEMVSQLLYGEHFKILEQRKYWSRIRMAFDRCEGWVLNQQISLIDDETYTAIEARKSLKYASDLVSFVETQDSVLLPVLLGSTVSHVDQFSHTFDGNFSQGKKKKTGW